MGWRTSSFHSMAKGMSNNDIEEQILGLYGFEVSTSTISRITDKVTNDIIVWQNRPLEPVYSIVWMDAIVHGECELKGHQ